MSLAERILAAQDLASELIEIPEWGANLEVRELNGEQMFEMAAMLSASDSGRLPIEDVAKIVVWSLYRQDNGEPVFALEHIPELVKKSHRSLMRIFNAAVRLSRVDGNLEDEEKK